MCCQVLMYVPHYVRWGVFMEWWIDMWYIWWCPHKQTKQMEHDFTGLHTLFLTYSNYKVIFGPIHMKSWPTVNYVKSKSVWTLLNITHTDFWDSCLIIACTNSHGKMQAVRTCMSIYWIIINRLKGNQLNAYTRIINL